MCSSLLHPAPSLPAACTSLPPTCLQARHSYFPSDIVWEHRFEPVLSRMPSGRMGIDFSAFDLTALNDASATSGSLAPALSSQQSQQLGPPSQQSQQLPPPSQQSQQLPQPAAGQAVGGEQGDGPGSPRLFPMRSGSGRGGALQQEDEPPSPRLFTRPLAAAGYAPPQALAAQGPRQLLPPFMQQLQHNGAPPLAAATGQLSGSLPRQLSGSLPRHLSGSLPRASQSDALHGAVHDAQGRHHHQGHVHWQEP